MIYEIYDLFLLVLSPTLHPQQLVFCPDCFYRRNFTNFPATSGCDTFQGESASFRAIIWEH